EDVRGGACQDTLGAEQILDRERDAVERPALALREAFVAGRRHVERQLRGFGDEGVERPRRLHPRDIGPGQLARGKLFASEPGARRGQRQRRECAHSTTLGTAKNPLFGPFRADCGALPRIASRRSPSVTTSSRIGKGIAATLVIGATLSVSTS